MGVEIDIISRITERFIELSSAEKRIAQFILDDADAVTALPIAELARQANVSQASITRFAKTLGCRDVRDLKVRMTMVEEHLGSSIIAISGVNSRLDRLADRVERIENRLDLTDHH